MKGKSIQMDKPGENTPVPAGTKGRILDHKDGLGWEVEWQTGVTTFWPGNGDEVSLVTEPGEYQCDFCNSRDVRWEHRAHDNESMLVAIGGGQTAAVGQGSIGSWAACEPCHRLIEAGKRDVLAKRAARKFARQSGNGMPFALILTSITQAHRMYWNFAVGPGIPIRQEADR